MLHAKLRKASFTLKSTLLYVGRGVDISNCVTQSHIFELCLRHACFSCGGLREVERKMAAGVTTRSLEDVTGKKNYRMWTS